MRKVKRKSQMRNKGKTCVNGCEAPAHCKEMCSNCYKKDYYNKKGRKKRGAKKHILLPIGTKRINTLGYVDVKTSIIKKGKKAWRKEHRYVFEQYLGRKLESFENIHHINGDKTDNNITNLELWVTSQPSGQRIKDLIIYAEWILKTYRK